MNLAVMLPLPGGLALPLPRKEKNLRKCRWGDAISGGGLGQGDRGCTWPSVPRWLAFGWIEHLVDPAFFFRFCSNPIGLEPHFPHCSSYFHIFHHIFPRFFSDLPTCSPHFSGVFFRPFIDPWPRQTTWKPPETGTFGPTCRRSNGGWLPGGNTSGVGKWWLMVLEWIEWICDSMDINGGWVDVMGLVSMSQCFTSPN